MRRHDTEGREAQRIQDAISGDPEARDWLVEHFSATVLRFTIHMMGNEQDARDATQEPMVKVLRNLHRYNDSWRFSTWIIAIARNTCIDEFRRRRRRSYGEAPDVADTAPSPLELSSQQQRARRLHQALEMIPSLYREVLILYHFEHRTYKEISAMLEIPIGTVMNRIFRARRRLRAAYDVIDSGEGAAADD